MAFAAVPSGTACFSGVQALRALTINHRNVGLDALTDSAGRAVEVIERAVWHLRAGHDGAGAIARWIAMLGRRAAC